tara:strand:- start:3311 stop:6655 length:3345 start_codon:yes stop_codon:yes gene_type:complete
MATQKLNSRSPYFVTSTGAEGTPEQDLSINIVQVNADGTERNSPGVGTFGANITLRAKPVNFVPTGTYTWAGGSSTGTSQDITFTETQGGGAAQQELSYTVSATAPDGTTKTSAAFKVNFATATQYTAELTITNNILPSFSSAGYTGIVTRNATNMSASADALVKEEESKYSVTGVNGDSYSFTIALTVADGYTASPALAASTASFSGTFGSADVTLASTLSGTLSLDSTYTLTPSVTSATEGSPFTIELTTTNVTDNSTVPFAITGVSADDLKRGSLTGAFQIFNNTASIEFEAIKDTTSEQPYETFTLTLSDISPTVSTSVKIYDEVAQITPSTVLVSTTGRSSDKIACADTAGETAYFVLLDGQSAIGEGVTLFSDQSLETPYASDGKYYKIGSSHNGIIGEVADGRISAYVECGSGTTTGVVEESVTIPNSGVISSESVSVPGPGGNTACDLVADTEIYYNGSITEGSALYTQKDSDNNLSSLFGGVDKWHKLILFDSNDNPQNHYTLITSYPPGYVSRVFVCGTDSSPDTTITTAPKVTINMETEDGNNQGFAFVSQETTLTAVPQNITNPTYQWEKGSSSGASNLSNISGETSSKLEINKSGGSETQTTTGDVYYNCKVSGTGVTNQRADTDKKITWQARPSFSLKFAADPSDTGVANNAACTGSSITIHGDRNAVTNFCVGTKFFANADGSGTLTRGTYSNSTSGTNNNYRYIAATGIAGPCINHGCAGPPVSQPTTSIQKIKVRRCNNQTYEGRVEYLILDNFEFLLNQIISLSDFGQTGGAGCYKIIEVYADSYNLPTGFFTIETSDLENAQPYGKCETCVGDIEVSEEEEVVVDVNKYYGAYRFCGSTGGTLTYIVSDSPLPNVLRVGADTTKCRHTVFALHNNEGDVRAYSADALVFEDLYWTPFNDCETCIGGSSAPTVTGLTYKRTYKQCDDASKTIVFGHTDNLAATAWAELYPTVVYNGICYEDSTTATATTVINIDDLIRFRDCSTCDAYVNPPPPAADPEPSAIQAIRISATTDTSSIDACTEIDTYPNTVYYTGTFQDGVYLYADTRLSSKYYTASSNQFHKTETNIVFKIGRAASYSDPVPEGQVYDVEFCEAQL